MRRREFIGLVGGLSISPLPARSQQSTRVFKIGYLAVGSKEQQLHLIKAFEQRMRQLGYRVGENLVIEFRFAEGNLSRLDANAEELVTLNVDVILVSNNLNVAAAMKATKAIPIVMAASVDPVGSQLIESLARPGGNVTGFTQDTGAEIYGKRLELLKEAVPGLSRVGVLWNPHFPPNASRLVQTIEASKALGLAVVSAEVRGTDDLERSFAAMVEERVQAVAVLAEPVLFNCRDQIAALAMRERLPSISSGRDFATAGLLLAYGVDFQALFGAIAVVVDKIFRSAKVADLPVEQPTKFEFVVNLKSARSIGLAVPPSLLARADEVIE